MDYENGHGCFRRSPWASNDILITLADGLSLRGRGLVCAKGSPLWSFPTDDIDRLRAAIIRVNPDLKQALEENWQETMQKKISQLAEKIKAADKTVAFTGAGISTESGIPDYRSQGGIWEKFRPVYFDEFMTSRKKRREYWQRWQDLYRGIMKAAPNPAHLALARLHAMGLLEAVVTQNVDGLHQAAGVPPEKVIELHGNTRRIRCMRCRRIIPTEDVLQRLASADPAPECDVCGGYFKPDTISFGQAMPREQVRTASDLACECDLFIVVGSTLVVQPAAHLPLQAKDHGAFLAIINLSETPCDGACDVLIREKAGIVLPAIVEKLENL